MLLGFHEPSTRSLAHILPPNLKTILIRADGNDFEFNLMNALRDALLSDERLPSIQVVNGNVDEARENLKDIRGIGVKVTVSVGDLNEESRFLLYRTQDTKTE